MKAGRTRQGHVTFQGLLGLLVKKLGTFLEGASGAIAQGSMLDIDKRPRKVT